MFTWHLLNENEEDAIHYISSLLKANRNNDQNEQYWFPTPGNPGDEASHTPIQKRILRELRNLQEAATLNPQENEESRRKFLINFDWKDFMLQQHEIKQIEALLIEFYDIFARHIFDIGMNEEFIVKFTPKTTHRPTTRAYQIRSIKKRTFWFSWRYFTNTVS